MSAKTKDWVAWDDAGRPARLFMVRAYQQNEPPDGGDFDRDRDTVMVDSAQFWTLPEAEAWMAAKFDLMTVAYCEGTTAPVIEDMYEDEEYGVVFDVMHDDDGWVYLQSDKFERDEAWEALVTPCT